MNVITCTGYYGTGSSAITDLMKEYDNVACKTDFEVAWIYDYNGINSLHYHLVKNPTRQGNRAIYDFLKYCESISSDGMKMNYQKYFNGKFMQYTYEYIEEIGGNSFNVTNWKGFRDKNKIYRLFFRIINKMNDVIKKGNSQFLTGLSPITYYFHTVDEDFFFKCTKDYLNKLLGEINTKEYLMIDQLVSSSKIDNCAQYFDNIKVIVVDRDPRDIFLSMKYIWKSAGDIEISKNVSVFCEWYKWNRHLDFKQKEKYLYVQFEDMLWDYENSLKKIEKYCGLSSNNHTAKKKYFIPEVSKKNCKLWYKYEHEKENIKYIERHLREYLYVK